MEPTTRWETAAVRSRSGRPRPGATQAGPSQRVDRSGTPAAGDAVEATDVAGARRVERVDSGVETLVVPLSAWNRMIDQLGNLHEAGRELAEARERAARAETEAAFLRERLAEMRGAAASAEPPGDGDVAGDEAPSVSSTPSGGVLGGARRVVRGATGWLRDRRR